MPQRWMLFVDGENFTKRAQDYSKSQSWSLQKGKWWTPDDFIWFPGLAATRRAIALKDIRPELNTEAERSYYFTSFKAGNLQVERDLCSKIWRCGFEPVVFQRFGKTNEGKGVDIELAVTVLRHAYGNDFDTAVIVTGDADFAPLFNELRRLGKRVILFMLPIAMADELVAASDEYVSMEYQIKKCWTSVLNGDPPVARTGHPKRV